MRHQLLLRICAVAAICAVCSQSPADVITALSGDISPGSTNTFAEGPFIGDSLAEPTLVYNDNTSIDVLVTVDETGKYLLAEGDFGAVTNLSGSAWSGFQAVLVSSPGDTTFAFLNGGVNLFDGTNQFPNSSVSGDGLTATLSGGMVPSGTTDTPQITFQVSAAGTYDIRETPILAPEPGSIVMLTLGALGLLMAARRRAA